MYDNGNDDFNDDRGVKVPKCQSVQSCPKSVFPQVSFAGRVNEQVTISS